MSLRTFTLSSPFSKLFTAGATANVVKSCQKILDFKRDPEGSLAKILTRSDKEIGGYSTVDFKYNPTLKCGQFSGYLNLDLPKDNPEITRSGYAMFRTKDQDQSWLSGNSYWDWSQYSSLVMRVQGDRRKYLVNIQANTPLVTDLFQHRLFLNKPGEWETVIIPLDDFVMTNWGVIQDGCEINKAEVKTIGVGLLDKQYGPFNLNIDWVKVMTDQELENYTNGVRKGTNNKNKQSLEGDEADIKIGHGSALNTNQYQEPKDTVF